MGEGLSGRSKDLVNEYSNGFEAMTEATVAIDDLVKIQHEMIGAMPDHHREFLIAFERGEPDWSLLKIGHVAALPAIRWRQRNLDKLKPDQRSALVELLRTSLGRRT
jgi:hypothetical protein